MRSRRPSGAHSGAGFSANCIADETGRGAAPRPFKQSGEPAVAYNRKKGGVVMKEIGAGILAGGRSSRLGQDKAFLQWDGQSLLERTIQACRGFEQVLVSVDRKERFAHLAEQMVEDELQNFGPVEGIYQLCLLYTSGCTQSAAQWPAASFSIRIGAISSSKPTPSSTALSTSLASAVISSFRRR